jgi:hypothetical protein
MGGGEKKIAQGKQKENSCKGLYFKKIIDTSKNFLKKLVQVKKVPPPPPSLF